MAVAKLCKVVLVDFAEWRAGCGVQQKALKKGRGYISGNCMYRNLVKNRLRVFIFKKVAKSRVAAGVLSLQHVTATCIPG